LRGKGASDIHSASPSSAPVVSLCWYTPSVFPVQIALANCSLGRIECCCLSVSALQASPLRCCPAPVETRDMVNRASKLPGIQCACHTAGVLSIALERRARYPGGPFPFHPLHRMLARLWIIRIGPIWPTALHSAYRNVLPFAQYAPPAGRRQRV
jgi:hypothetical protein